MYSLVRRGLTSKFLPVALSFYLAAFPGLFCTHESTVNAGTKEKIGEFLKKHEKSKFWKWFYKMYLKSPSAFEEWVIMVPSIAGIAALGGAGYGVYKHLPPDLLSDIKQKLDEKLHKGNNDVIKTDTDKNKISQKDFTSKIVFNEKKDFCDCIKDKSTIDGLYNELYKNLADTEQELMKERLETIKSEYEQQMKGTGWGSFIWPRVSDALQAFKGEICELKIVAEMFCQKKNTDGNKDINELVEKWINELGEKEKKNEKLNDDELNKAREFICNGVGKSCCEEENNEGTN